MQPMTSSAQTPAIHASEAAAVAPANAAVARSHVQAVQSEELLQGKKAVEISHNGAIYRLQATRLGKLILTK
jgi:hemin uptake protein HemP